MFSQQSYGRDRFRSPPVSKWSPARRAFGRAATSSASTSTETDESGESVRMRRRLPVDVVPTRKRMDNALAGHRSDQFIELLSLKEHARSKFAANRMPSQCAGKFEFKLLCKKQLNMYKDTVALFSFHKFRSIFKQSFAWNCSIRTTTM